MATTKRTYYSIRYNSRYGNGTFSPFSQHVKIIAHNKTEAKQMFKASGHSGDKIISITALKQSVPMK